MSKVFPLAKNLIGQRSKSMSSVKIDPWPSFGHIFMHMIFQNIKKSIENEEFQWDFMLSLKAMEKRWPSGQIR